MKESKEPHMFLKRYLKTKNTHTQIVYQFAYFNLVLIIFSYIFKNVYLIPIDILSSLSIVNQMTHHHIQSLYG